jgi:heat shock protein HtpX
MWLALALALIVNAYAYWQGPGLILAAHGAAEINRATAPNLVDLVRALAHSAGIPAPRIFVSENPQPNAFAIGRGRADAAIILTSQLLEILTEEELAGVLSHELAHIRSRDTLTMTISATIVGAIVALSAALFLIGRITRGGKGVSIIFMAILAPLAAAILQLMLSRSREYAADKAGAMICGHPDWLASALWKLAKATKQADNLITLRYPATAPLHIVDPLPDLSWTCLFATLPPIERRIARLNQMGPG